MTERTPRPEEGIDREIDARGIFKVGIWLAAVTVASFLFAWGFYRALARSEAQRDAPPSPLVEASRPPAAVGPQLQPVPERELAAFRSAEQRVLEGWGWTDRAAGRAQVPVERAIAEVAAAGALPEFMPPLVVEPQ